MTPQELKQIRKQKGLSCQKMAEFLGLKAGRTVARYESGELPIPGTVQRILELDAMLKKGAQILLHKYKKLG